jgi:ABC-2 type transport system ATP-binding protein
MRENVDRKPCKHENARILISDMTICFDDRVILSVPEVKFHSGELTILIGSNGSGKTSLLRAITGDLKTSGEIVKDNGSRAIMVPDTPHVYDVLTVLEHFQFMSSLLRRTLKGPIDFGHLITDLALDPFTEKYGRDLSLGQRQRLALGMALLASPDILLLDEPFNGLDHASLKKTIAVLLSLKHRGVTIIIATHVLSNLKTLADRVLVLKDQSISMDQVMEESDVESWYSEWLQADFQVRSS